jgi:polyisoprenoid-binding protein YceI
MASKLLSGIGVAAILCLVGGSLAALAIVKQRIRVVIAAEEEAARRGPDPLELLRADLGVLAADVSAVHEGLGQRLQELHDALENAAAERDRSLETRIATLQQELALLRADLPRRDGLLLEQVRLELAARAAEAKAAPQAAELAAVAATEIPAPQAPPEAPPAAVPDPAASAGLAEPEALPKKGFLARPLPSGTFAFGDRQRFAIVPALSRVGFDAKSTLHDFSGVTSKVEGELTVTLAHADRKPAGRLTVEAASLDTGLAGRDEDMRKTLDVGVHKTLEFEWTSFSVTAVDEQAQTVSGTASGKLTVRGKSKPIDMPVRVSVDASKRLSIEGEAVIRLQDFDVKPPSQVGVIKVDDELKLWIALRARFVGKAKDGE